MKIRSNWIVMAALFFCLWCSLDLFDAWGTTYLRWGGVVFVIWILPALTYWMLPLEVGEMKIGSVNTLSLSVLLALLGVLGSIHTLSHIALALAIWSTTQPMLWNLPWLISALTWMPALSYFLKVFSVEAAMVGRVFSVVLGALWGITCIYYYAKSYEEV